MIRDINLSFLGFFKFYIYIYNFYKSYIRMCVYIYIYILIYIEKIHFCKERRLQEREREKPEGGGGSGRRESGLNDSAPHISELHADVLTRYSSPASPSTPPPHPPLGFRKQTPASDPLLLYFLHLACPPYWLSLAVSEMQDRVRDPGSGSKKIRFQPSSATFLQVISPL